MRKYVRMVLAISLVCIGAASMTRLAARAVQQPPAKVDFATDIQPILRQQCVTCHGPKQQKNGLRLDRRRDAMRGGTIAVIGPGNAEGSRLYNKLIGDKFGPRMPPTGALPPEQIAKIKAWIDQGAEWPDALSGDTPPPPPDPGAMSLMEAIRTGKRSDLASLVASNKEAVDKHGAGGATPLMYAALYADVAAMRTLIESGADVNASDESGSTALMWAAHDLEKSRFLIEKGADVNARSADSRTPLLVASNIMGNAPVVKLLLDAGANVNVRAPSLVGETTPLVQAAYVGDPAIFKMLVERGASLADAGAPALGLSMRAQCGDCIGILMKALNPAVFTEVMIGGSPPRGPALATAMLLEAGADINAKDPEGRTLLMLAAASTAMPVDVVKALIARGVDVNVKSPSGETALTYARRHGNTPVVQLLEQAGATDASPFAMPPIAFARASNPRAAVARSIPLLQKADVEFLKKSGCVSCHNNSLTAMTVALARSRSIKVDETIASANAKMIGDYLENWRGRVLQNIGIPGDSGTISAILLGLAAEKHPADPATDAMARYIRFQQLPAGFWLPLALRPPIEGEPIQTTAMSMRALQLYAPAADRESYKPVIDRAAAWLAAATPRATDGHVFKLLGMQWSGAGRAAIRTAARALIAQQRADGGWAQMPTMQSDPYATGQALVALIESGAIAIGDPVYKRGAEYLMKTQAADGSWFVHSRAVPLQPHFDAGFPYAKDQFISAAATNWAAMALTYASGKGS